MVKLEANQSNSSWSGFNFDHRLFNSHDSSLIIFIPLNLFWAWLASKPCSHVFIWLFLRSFQWPPSQLDWPSALQRLRGLRRKGPQGRLRVRVGESPLHFDIFVFSKHLKDLSHNFFHPIIESADTQKLTPVIIGSFVTRFSKAKMALSWTLFVAFTSLIICLVVPSAVNCDIHSTQIQVSLSFLDFYSFGSF